MEKAAQAWTAELSQAASDILNASHRLQKQFAEVSEKNVAAGKNPVPDPVKLIRRIGELERAIQNLTKDCEKISLQRGEIAPSVIEIQQRNVALLRQLSQYFPEAVQAEKENQVANEWDGIVDKLQEQATFFVPKEAST